MAFLPECRNKTKFKGATPSSAPQCHCRRVWHQFSFQPQKGELMEISIKKTITLGGRVSVLIVYIIQSFQNFFVSLSGMTLL